MEAAPQTDSPHESRSKPADNAAVASFRGGLNGTQRDVFLAVLATGEEPSGKDIVRQLRDMYERDGSDPVSRQSVYYALDSLIDAGYLEKTQSEGDKRERFYSVTEAGMQQFLLAKQQEELIVDEMLAKRPGYQMPRHGGQ